MNSIAIVAILAIVAIHAIAAILAIGPHDTAISPHLFTWGTRLVVPPLAPSK
jgi:hypothetical protein